MLIVQTDFQKAHLIPLKWLYRKAYKYRAPFPGWVSCLSFQHSLVNADWQLPAPWAVEAGDIMTNHPAIFSGRSMILGAFFPLSPGFAFFLVPDCQLHLAVHPGPPSAPTQRAMVCQAVTGEGPPRAGAGAGTPQPPAPAQSLNQQHPAQAMARLGPCVAGPYQSRQNNLKP